jgi:plastocyanin
MCLGFLQMPRKRLILAPLTAILALCAVSPSLAAESSIGVANFDFTPGTQNLAVGDTVTWTFNDGGHTTTSQPGQPDKWDSGPENQGDKFVKTFTKPGRYQYVCTPHESFMRGTLVVGKDTVKKTAGAVTAKVSGTKVTVSLTLKEAASAKLKLTGAAKRTVTLKRLKAGKHGIVVKRLKAGSYSATLTLSDDFDKKSTVKKSFQVR